MERKIATGQPGDLTNYFAGSFVDLRGEGISKQSRNSPFDGRTFKGAPMATIVAGRVVHNDKKRNAETQRSQRVNCVSRMSAANSRGRSVRRAGCMPCWGIRGCRGQGLDALAVEMIEGDAALPMGSPFRWLW